MREVEILDFKTKREIDKETGHEKSYMKKESIGTGLFHSWGCNYEEFGEGVPGNFSTAIIELPDGSVLNHPVELIKFLDKEEKKQ